MRNETTDVFLDEEPEPKRESPIDAMRRHAEKAAETRRESKKTPPPNYAEWRQRAKELNPKE